MGKGILLNQKTYPESSLLISIVKKKNLINFNKNILILSILIFLIVTSLC